MSAAIIPTGVLGWRDDLYYSCRIAAMAFGGATMDCEHTDTAASDFVRWLERRSPIRHFWRRLGGTRRAGGQRSRGRPRCAPNESVVAQPRREPRPGAHWLEARRLVGLVVHVVHRQPCCRSRLCVSLLRLRQKLTGPELLYELEGTFVCIAHEHRDDEGRAGEGRV